MPLSNEDSLRLNVMMAQKPKAIRIDDSKMIVYALTDKGEAKIQLNPNTREDRYLKEVRELLSTHFLGSPGGYPVYLRRWTRMGQKRDDESLERLLLLGEPEAVVAVVHAETLSDEIAAKAWWAMPTADNARSMLQHEEVVRGETGPRLAEYLVEFLPFEEEQWKIAESIRLVLQPGLISEAEREKLWKQGKRKTTYLLGFIAADPDNLPEQGAESPLLAPHREALESLAAEGNRYARQLLRLLSPAGQAFLETLAQVIRKPYNQDVVVNYLRVIERYFADTRPEIAPERGINNTRLYEDEGSDVDMRTLIQRAEDYCAGADNAEVAAVLEACPDLADALRAVVALSMVNELVVNPIFARTDAIGTVMRKKLEPVSGPILDLMGTLQGKKSLR
ncbi:MAG: sulfur reduction protein DsrS [Gammaproteobacteria bacterium]|nr:MAG: sulfur reduction protein DsrS [Gammaproteobacteria bacterium]